MTTKLSYQIKEIYEKLQESRNAYIECVDYVSDPVERGKAYALSVQRQRMMDELRYKARCWGFEAENKDSITAVLNQVCTDLQFVTARGDEYVITQEIKHCKHQLISLYEKTLQHDQPPELRSLLKRQLNEIKYDLADVPSKKIAA